LDAVAVGPHGRSEPAAQRPREFPPELLKVRDLRVRLGVTYYRAAGGAWGQYVVVFVVVDPGTVI
jgi:hypothetical protein